jgi:hypothetical protein
MLPQRPTFGVLSPEELAAEEYVSQEQVNPITRTKACRNSCSVCSGERAKTFFCIKKKSLANVLHFAEWEQGGSKPVTLIKLCTYLLSKQESVWTDAKVVTSRNAHALVFQLFANGIIKEKVERNNIGNGWIIRWKLATAGELQFRMDEASAWDGLETVDE